MCSTRDARIARLGEAIDELATTLRTTPAGEAGLGEVASRLAGIWEMIAELDPAVATRLRGYSADSP
jgi:hypothetical protein